MIQTYCLYYVYIIIYVINLFSQLYINVKVGLFPLLLNSTISMLVEAIFFVILEVEMQGKE